MCPGAIKGPLPPGVTIHAMGRRASSGGSPRKFQSFPRGHVRPARDHHNKGSRTSRDKVWRTLIRSAFSHRRKTLLNNLATFAGTRHEKAALLEKAGLSVSSRAEELELKHWSALLEILSPLIQGEKRQGTRAPCPQTLKP
jgi:hypothetical protein